MTVRSFCGDGRVVGAWGWDGGGVGEGRGGVHGLGALRGHKTCSTRFRNEAAKCIQSDNSS